MTLTLQTEDTLLASVSSATRRAAECLLSMQHPDGYWNALLTADSTLESDYVLFLLWLHPPSGSEWKLPAKDKARMKRAVQSILERQLPDGGFNIYPKGPSEVSATVKAYFALKLAGLEADNPRRRRLCGRILELGGIQAANSYVKVNLSLFNLYPRQYCPTIPPEVVLLPFDFLYQMSAWTRAIVVSLSILHAANPRMPVPEGFHLDEIWKPGASPAWSFRKDRQWLTWHNIFLSADWFLKWWERRGSKSIRRKAIEKAKEWMIERLHHSEGLGAIYPPMMYSVMALDVLGYAKDHP